MNHFALDLLPPVISTYIIKYGQLGAVVTDIYGLSSFSVTKNDNALEFSVTLISYGHETLFIRFKKSRLYLLTYMGGFYVDRKPEKLAPHSRSQISLYHLKKYA